MDRIDCLNKTSVVYKRIKSRREQIGMSQSELAKKVGYSDKTMISKIERGIIDLPLPKLNVIADALEISPAVLLGWDTENGDDIIEPRFLDSKNALRDLELVHKYNQLTPEEQKSVMDFLISKHN